MVGLLGACYGPLRPLLFQLDAEFAHRITLAALSTLPAVTPAPDPPQLRTELFGVAFSNPIGLAAGMDKDGRALKAWNALGFGFAEIGTVTPRPQAGNPRPRIWRLPAYRAMVNQLGFPSEGIETVAARIAHKRKRMSRFRLALNLGPNKTTPPEMIAEDYASMIRPIASVADFVVVNVSSPNTPGLRDLQMPDRVGAIIEAMRKSTGERLPPILIKIAPDLPPSLIDDICDAALALHLDGIVATNTTIQRREIGVDCGFAGGLSGEPLQRPARSVIARIYDRTRGRLSIIGVGGIANAEDAYGHIRAGANMVELYTGLVYRGPAIVHEIKSGLIRLLARDGFRSISEAVGS